ncbi:MAG: TIM barrel protein [Candidatus Aenigmatarchaeota archaeon]
MPLKVGLKLYSGNPRKKIEEAIKIADFVEVLIEPNIDFTFLKKYKTVFEIHCAHRLQGFNPADRMKWHKSEKMLDDAVCAANLLDAKKIIVHLGMIESKNCSLDNALKFFEIYQKKHGTDKRMLLENLCRISKETLIMNLPDESKKMMKRLGYGLCLDFSHAAVTAKLLSLDYKDVISGFAKLGPKYFHVCDGRTSSKIDLHLGLEKGNFDLEFFKRVIKKSKSKQVLLEVPHNIKRNRKEIAFMKK